MDPAQIRGRHLEHCEPRTYELQGAEEGKREDEAEEFSEILKTTNGVENWGAGAGLKGCGGFRCRAVPGAGVREVRPPVRWRLAILPYILPEMYPEFIVFEKTDGHFVVPEDFYSVAIIQMEYLKVITV